MPAITLLVGVSAFSYAMTSKKVSFLPELKSSARGTFDSGEKLIPSYSSRKKYTVRECKDKDGYISTTIDKICPTGTKEHSKTTVTTN